MSFNVAGGGRICQCEITLTEYPDLTNNTTVEVRLAAHIGIDGVPRSVRFRTLDDMARPLSCPLCFVMSIGDCQICRVLLEAASLSMRRHLEAVSKVALAVQKGIPKREIIALENHARSHTLNRENAGCSI